MHTFLLIRIRPFSRILYTPFLQQTEFHPPEPSVSSDADISEEGKLLLVAT